MNNYNNYNNGNNYNNYNQGKVYKTNTLLKFIMIISTVLIISTAGVLVGVYAFKGTSGSGIPTLNTPIGLTVSPASNELQWTKVDNATKYYVKIDDNTLSTQDSVNKYPLGQLSIGTHKLSVQAVGNGINYINSKWSDSIDYVVSEIVTPKPELDTPTGLTVPQGSNELQWTRVNNAVKYNVKIDSTVYALQDNNNKYQLGTLSVGTHQLSVQAVGDNINYSNSAWSASINYIVEEITEEKPPLNAPTASVSNKTLSWNPITGAVRYDVSVDDAISSTTATAFDLSTLTAYKTYQLKVRAIANPVNNQDSIWSNTVLYENQDPGSGGSDADAMQARWEKYMPRDYYEQSLPNRFGTPGWKADKYNAITPFYRDKPGYGTAWLQSRGDFYSYDNWITALRKLASIKATYEWQNGERYLVSVEDKVAGTVRNIVNNKTPDKSRAILRQTVDYGDFLNSKNENDNKREIAGLLGQFMQESNCVTWSDYEDKFEWGLAFNEETSYIGSTSTPEYTDPNNANYPPVEGASYHGRGPIQLSWNFNYGPFSETYLGDKNILLRNPAMLCDDNQGSLSIAGALWFWMTPSAPKASCHDVIFDKFVHATNSPYHNCYGLTTIIVNGGFENNQTEQSNPAVKNRANAYRYYANVYGADITGEKLDTAGFPAWT